MGAFIWDLVKILVIALVIIVPFRMFIAEPFVVSGSSMLPNFHNNDYLIVDRISYKIGAPNAAMSLFCFTRKTLRSFL